MRHEEKGRASLSVVPVIPGAPPPAPVELDEAESRIWDAVLRSMRQDWYSPAIAPLLRAYCTECVTAELLERKLRELREFSPATLTISVRVPGRRRRWNWMRHEKMLKCVNRR